MRTAIRRHYDDRILRRRLALLRNQWAREDVRGQGIRRNTGTTCSCLFCRSQSRRYSGPSVQERRQVAWLEGD